jgi:hypothetical protein
MSLNQLNNYGIAKQGQNLSPAILHANKHQAERVQIRD